jgi:hypothetical protein
VKNKSKKIAEDFGAYGGFSIHHPDSTCWSEGHFWIDRNTVTKKWLYTNLVRLIDKFRIDENWTDEWYDEQLKFNLMTNHVEYLHEKEVNRKLRKLKLEQIGKS